jgi:hypothetical protein
MKDLTNIPERYHCLFLTDWNNGDKSEMTILQRNEMSLLYLEYNRWDVQRMINSKKPIEPELNIGFEKL